MENQITLKLDGNNFKKYQNFFNNYQPLNYLSSENTLALKPASKRTCRYCGKKYPEVRFKKAAHFFPELLGSHSLKSDFECDICNELFAKYETSLAAFIGPFRSAIGVLGKGGAKKHKDPKTGFKIFQKDGKTQIQVIQKDANDTTEEEVEISQEDKTLRIKTIKESYIPLFVFKILVKIGIGLLPEEEVSKYNKALDFLQNNDKNEIYSGFPIFKLFMYFVPGPFYQKPFITIFKRNHDILDLTLPEHVLTVSFSNHVYQIFLPFHEDDKQRLLGKQVSLPITPILADTEIMKQYGNYQFYNIDLSSSDKKVREPVHLNFGFEKVIMEDLTQSNISIDDI